MKINKLNIIAFLISSIFFYSCGKASTPRPYGYFRVDIPSHQYVRFDSAALPYTFEKSTLAAVKPVTRKGENYWIDITYSHLKANIYCSYKPVKSNLFQLLKETHSIVYKHSIRADAITEKAFENPEKRVFGILYELTGNTASTAQFVLTDSLNHFFRGALYFDQIPNKDSIAPMAEYISRDIVRLMESFEWKKTN